MCLLLGGCGDDPHSEGWPPWSYLEPTSPENLIENLQTAYLAHEIDGYSPLLAPEFVFKVQPVDVAVFGEFFTRDRDSTGTAALFNSPIVSAIRIDLPHGPATVPTDTAFAAGTMTIRIQPTFLEVDEVGEITWQVDGDIQDLFFRRGNPDDGEAPARWFIIEWRDLPGGRAAVGSELSIVPMTWGRLKSIYR